MSFEWYNDQKAWVLRTEDGTYAIALSFIFLAYLLHPAVEKAYERVRAYRAWRAVERRQTVEVTKYPLAKEILRGRGKWDAARIVAILLAAFSVASWGLELQLDLASIEDTLLDLFLRPPPVFLKEDNRCWEVTHPEDDELNAKEGEVANMFGSYDDGSAKAIYKVEGGARSKVEGNVRVAFWSNVVDDERASLFYNIKDTPTEVISLNCSQNSTVTEAALYIRGEEEEWGTVRECEHGPELTSDFLELANKSESPPTILLNSSDGAHVFLIVEEISSYPSFLYSVWEPKKNADGLVELDHVFHIASTARLAEAVVTEVVHASREDSRMPTGGSSFALLRQFSDRNSTYEDRNRAAPFGENPNSETSGLGKLSEVEKIFEGVNLNTTALICGVWLLVLTLIGTAWSLCLRSSIGMDVYDRDELIRAVSLPGSVTEDTPLSALRIFVRKEDNGSMSVVISDTAEHENSCWQFLQRGGNIVENDNPAPVPGAAAHYNGNFGGAVVPAGPRTVWLEGFRSGMSKPFPGRNGNHLYPITLGASPVPSNVNSLAGTPLPIVPTRGPAGAVMGERGPSRLFDTGHSCNSSGESDSDVEAGSGSGAGINGGHTARPEIEMGRWGRQRQSSVALGRDHSDAGGVGGAGSEERNTSERTAPLSGEPSPLPSRGLARAFTPGRGSRGSGERLSVVDSKEGGRGEAGIFNDDTDARGGGGGDREERNASHRTVPLSTEPSPLPSRGLPSVFVSGNRSRGLISLHSGEETEEERLPTVENKEGEHAEGLMFKEGSNAQREGVADGEERIALDRTVPLSGSSSPLPSRGLPSAFVSGIRSRGLISLHSGEEAEEERLPTVENKEGEHAEGLMFKEGSDTQREGVADGEERIALDRTVPLSGSSSPLPSRGLPSAFVSGIRSRGLISLHSGEETEEERLTVVESKEEDREEGGSSAKSNRSWRGRS